MKYAKALAAGVGAALMVLASVITGGIAPTEAAQIGVAFLGAVAVWNTANLPSDAPFAKAVTALLAAGGVLVTALPGGLTQGEIVNVVIAALAIFPVFRVPNVGDFAAQVRARAAARSTRSRAADPPHGLM
jgi:hypothetical protein